MTRYFAAIDMSHAQRSIIIGGTHYDTMKIRCIMFCDLESLEMGFLSYTSWGAKVKKKYDDEVHRMKPSIATRAVQRSNECQGTLGQQFLLIANHLEPCKAGMFTVN